MGEMANSAWEADMKRMQRVRKRYGRNCRFSGYEILAVALAGVMALTPTAGAAQDTATTRLLDQVRAADMRLAAIGYRLATANAALCDRLEPGTGLQLHAIEQYDGAVRDAARSFFGFATPVAVEGVVPGSPADRAGLRAGDALSRIGPVTIDADSGKGGATTQRIVQLHQAVAMLPPSAPLPVDRIANGASGEVVIQPVPACRTRFELKLDGGLDAQADGTMVQIGARFLEDYPDDELAALVAHELSHNILHHRDRLEAKGVNFGMLAGFGGNVKYFRQTETEADLLSVYLLANAGYDVRAAARFWGKFGKRTDAGFLAERTHPGWKDRRATVEHEAALIEANPTRPIIPPLVATRDKPLDGNWQALLVRHD